MKKQPNVKITRVLFPEIERYETQLMLLKQRNEDFTEYISGSTRRIKFRSLEYAYVDIKSNAGLGFHISRMLKADVDRWLEKNRHELQHHLRAYKEQMYNIEAIKKSIGQPLVAIDINDCYWTTVWRLGYITDETYYAAKRKKEWKIGRNASIGSLSKSEVSTPYRNGKPIASQRKVVRSRIEYQYIRNHVINKVYEIFYRLFLELQDTFFMFLTDCVFTTPANYNYVVKFFQTEGYSVKMKPIEFLKVDEAERKILWLDFIERDNERDTGAGAGVKYVCYANHQIIDSGAALRQPLIDKPTVASINSIEKNVLIGRNVEKQ